MLPSTARADEFRGAFWALFHAAATATFLIEHEPALFTDQLCHLIRRACVASVLDAGIAFFRVSWISRDFFHRARRQGEEDQEEEEVSWHYQKRKLVVNAASVVTMSWATSSASK